MRLHFVCVGGNKCGTTWLSAMLTQHPELAVASSKEPHFFSAHYDRGLAWYRERWEGVEGLRGEFSTSYLYDDKALRRLSEHFPAVRLLVLLRHPLERSVSHFRHRLRTERAEDPAAFLRSYPEIVENSLYGERLASLEKLFAPEQVRVLFFDDVREWPLRLLRQTFDHLEVATDFVPEGYEEPVGRGFTPRSRNLERLRMLVYRTLKARGLHGVIRAVKRSGLTAWYRSLNDEGLSDNRVESLRNALIPSIDRMRRDLGRAQESPLIPDENPLEGWKRSLPSTSGSR